MPAYDFLEPTDLQDMRVGFSAYKDSKEEGFKPLFRVYIDNRELEKDNDRKRIIITVNYGKETVDGIILSSSEF